MLSNGYHTTQLERQMQNKHMLEICKGKEKKLTEAPLYRKKITIITLLSSVNGDIVKASPVLLHIAASVSANPCKRAKVGKDPQQKQSVIRK